MRNYSWKHFTVLVFALAVLFGGSLAQAQSLPAPEGLHVARLAGPSWTALEWDPVPGAEAYDVFVRGPGKWRPKKGGGWVSKRSNVNAPNFPSFVIEDLVVGKSYNFRVRAIDSQGVPGAISRKITYSPPPDPKQPKISTTSDSISLSWNGKGIQTVWIYYEVSESDPNYNPSDRSPSQSGHVTVKRGGSAKMSGLLSDTEYRIDFTVNRKGHSHEVSKSIRFTARTK